LIKKKDFLVVGGFNEVDLKVAFNDIDLCLKIGRLKKKVVYTPYAKLYHYESKSRGSDETKRNINRFTKEKNYMKLNWNID
jgi:GT2 family glycosyltransferase